MKRIWYLLFTFLLLVAVWAGFYYKDALLNLYQTTVKSVQENVQSFQQTNLGTTINQVTKEVLAPTPLNMGGTANSVVLTREKIIAQTNIQRFDNGKLPALKENAQLDAAALAKANDIFKNQYFEHVSPSGVDPGTLVKSFGYDYIVSGENLILGNFSSEQEVVQDWMNSPGHRANILNNRYVDIGVAIVKGIYKGQSVWVGVQEFGLPLSACSQPNANVKTQIDNDTNSLDQLSAQINAKLNQINSTDKNSPQYNTLVDQYNVLVAQYNQLSQTAKNLIAEYNNQVNTFNQCVVGN